MFWGGRSSVTRSGIPGPKNTKSSATRITIWYCSNVPLPLKKKGSPYATKNPEVFFGVIATISRNQILKSPKVLQGAPPRGRQLFQAIQTFIQSVTSSLSYLKSCNPVGGHPVKHCLKKSSLRIISWELRKCRVAQHGRSSLRSLQPPITQSNTWGIHFLAIAEFCRNLPPKSEEF